MSSDLRTILLSRDKPNMVQFLYDHPEFFNDAISLALSDKQPIAWRAAWAIGGTLPENAEKISAFIPDILSKLSELQDGHQREFIKILLQSDLDDDQQGQLFDICVTIWEQVRKKASVRYFAFQVMADLVKKYPELSHEVLSLTQPQYINSLSPGIRQGVLKIMHQISE
ncbi:MAG: hypothetical protein ACMZ7B_01170 [Balneola sp.]